MGHAGSCKPGLVCDRSLVRLEISYQKVAVPPTHCMLGIHCKLIMVLGRYWVLHVQSNLCTCT